jgi:hypothetical protein
MCFRAWRWQNYLYNYSDNALRLSNVYVVFYVWQKAVGSDAAPRGARNNVAVINHVINSHRLLVTKRNHRGAVRAGRAACVCRTCGGCEA